jgi:hypothetical protein
MIVRIIPAGDLALVGGTFVFLQPGPEYTRQKLAARLKFFLGEWFLDRRLGVPYFKHVFVRNPDLDVIRQMFRKVILGTAGVLGIVDDAITLTYDRVSRSLSVSFAALVEGGVVTVNPGDPDFIISL